MSEKSGDFLKGILIGGLIGIIAGILYAPKSGKETREGIARITDDLICRAKDEFYEVEDKVTEFVHNSAEAIADNKSRLEKAIDAGAAAYREEKTKKS